MHSGTKLGGLIIKVALKIKGCKIERTLYCYECIYNVLLPLKSKCFTWLQVLGKWKGMIEC